LNAAVSGTGITAANNAGVWNNVGGALTAIARKGTLTPGPNLGAGVTFSSVSNATLNPSGKSAFTGIVAGASIDSSNDIGIWSNVGGALAVIAREGGAGPGPNLGAGVNFDQLSGASINAAGAVTFYGHVTGQGIDTTNASGIWSSFGGPLQIVARTGSGGPGPNLGAGVNFSALNAPLLNATDSVAFMATINGPGTSASNDFGIWTNSGGTLQAVIREGSSELGPQLGEGVYFDERSTKSWSMAMNGVGEVVVAAPLIGTGVTSSNDSGIWAWTNGQLIKIIREGDQIDVNPDPGVDDLRTILHYSLNGGSGDEDGRRMALNDNGRLVFSLFFLDGTAGVFTAQLPRHPGDFDHDGDVDGADFVAWQTHFPMASGATWANGDADSDGDVDGADFVIWQTNFPTPTGPAAVPEPPTIALALLSLPVIARAMRCRLRSSPGNFTI
jgi:hypothetical protein